ncbi:MAG: polysulfide reductase [Bacteroidetes bacterium GWE2_41_25]|nr:MAG: polysulfide reductase [Bacteroidetes bacterium GWA2_40_15]OFX96833.1 MAG: polysulfide reductase [Bacteroidetes bacterium GWE2_41_25]OFY00039.1 MAG: polysulfide reductase [Bacteroidetes bacterium GWC2_40_22]OFY57293.1 MAG: polysulfide reductase [Bacteroidetes bacterium GWF2_41_9]HBH83916.1 polysulfide reductase [Bacteroidales bacterium]
MEPNYQHLYEILANSQGYIFPNEIDLQWGILIVVYPFVTGLVAGAFILASLERVFKDKILKPTYQIALLTALSFLLVATLPLISHLSQPQRAYEIMITPHGSSAMAIFGFVYLWYLMVVLLLEIWFDYRHSMVVWADEKKGIMKWVYRILTLGLSDISPRTLTWDRKLGYFITVVGIPSAFILHGYVGFIFGSIKANPWWSTPLMPIIFLFSAMVSGISMVMLIYMVVSYIRTKTMDINVLDSIGKYLFFVLILDFTIEGLDQIHRIYEAEESFETIKLLVEGKLYLTLFISQGLIGTIIPLIVLAFLQFYKGKIKLRKTLYFIIGILVLIGVYSMRWNVVIGGQLFSKSFSGFTSFKVGLIGLDGTLMAAFWLILPFGILAFLLWLLPPWKMVQEEE